MVAYPVVSLIIPRTRMAVLLSSNECAQSLILNAHAKKACKSCLLNFPTKGLRSKRRRYFHIFQVEAYLTYCEDIDMVGLDC